MTHAEMVMKDRNIAKLSRAPSPKGSMRSAAVRQVNMISLGANFCPKKSRTLRTLNAERCGRQCAECHTFQPLGSPDSGSPSIHWRNSYQCATMAVAWGECVRVRVRG